MRTYIQYRFTILINFYLIVLYSLSHIITLFANLYTCKHTENSINQYKDVLDPNSRLSLLILISFSSQIMWNPLLLEFIRILLKSFNQIPLLIEVRYILMFSQILQPFNLLPLFLFLFIFVFLIIFLILTILK